VHLTAVERAVPLAEVALERGRRPAVARRGDVQVVIPDDLEERNARPGDGPLVFRIE
jgi:hypothetical protein